MAQPTTFAPSPYQQAFFDWVEKGTGSCILVAVAGSGKSTSILQSLRYVPEREHVQILAFNAAIAKDLNVKLDALREELGRPFAHARASTFHSLCFGALTRYLKARDLKPDPKKLEKLFPTVVAQDARLVDLYSNFVCKLVGLAKGQGVGALGAQAPDVPDAWWGIIRHHDLELDAEGAEETVAVDLARKLLALSNEAARNGVIDFDDMLYLVCLWKLKLWQNDRLYVDEAQDTNPVRRAVARLALKPGGRLVAVGDPKQGIYGFTGASHDALDQIKAAFKAIELPLTVSYRCSKAVIRKAQTLVPYIEAFEGAPEGQDLELPLEDALKLLKPTDAILCRNTAPLIGTAYALIAKGVGCYVLGREIGNGLVKLVDQRRAKTLEQLAERLGQYKEREVAKFTARGEEQKADAVCDRVECLNVLMDNLPDDQRTVAALRDRVAGMFADSGNTLTLSTLHKAKGREWDTVAIIRPDLMPSKWARQEHQQEQEQNLMYVGWTRAKHTLITVLAPPPPAKPGRGIEARSKAG